MIDARELRIGNYIDNCRQWCFVMSIYKNNKVELGYFNDSIGFVRSLDDYGIKPILLTEQWLLDFGFEKKSWKTKNIIIECFYYQLNDFIVYLVADFFEIELINESGDQFNLFKKWKNVHQLQNLYFSLTGSELICK